MLNIEDLVGIHSLKPLVPINKFPIVIDNFLTFDKYQELINFVFNSDWQFGWRTSNNVDQFIFNSNYVKVPKDNLENIEDKLEQPLLKEIWLIVKERLGLKELVRCYANLTMLGVDAYPHIDSNTEDYISVVIYIADNWNVNFGGATALFFLMVKL